MIYLDLCSILTELNRYKSKIATNCDLNLLTTKSPSWTLIMDTLGVANIDFTWLEANFVINDLIELVCFIQFK